MYFYGTPEKRDVGDLLIRILDEDEMVYKEFFI